MNKIKFVATAVRWFDKVNGNTYHSVQITRVKDGKTIYCPITYGYGEHYQQTALEAMEKAKWLPKEYRGQSEYGYKKYYHYERENNYPIMWSVTNGFKRDCVANGEE